MEEIPAKFGYLNGSGQIRTVFAQEVSYDLCICIDSSDKERLGEGQGIFGLAKDTLCIDHHITNEGFAASNVIDPGASSSCEVLYGLLEDSMITKETAECLYTGIIHDTGVFKYSNTSTFPPLSMKAFTKKHTYRTKFWEGHYLRALPFWKEGVFSA